MEKAISGSSSSLIISAKFENLEKICNFVDEIARKAGFNETALYSIETAVDEACSNIIDHAYQGEGLGEIECICLMNGENLEITLHDFGSAFDPGSISDPDLTSPINTRNERGLGLYFMRTLMDEVHFQFSDLKGNILTMVKHRD
jgi:serine/threonine-protein kinase RsbW